MRFSPPNMVISGSKKPRCRWPVCQTWGFRMLVHNIMGDVTVATSICFIQSTGKRKNRILFHSNITLFGCLAYRTFKPYVFPFTVTRGKELRMRTKLHLWLISHYLRTRCLFHPLHFFSWVCGFGKAEKRLYPANSCRVSLLLQHHTPPL